jgi:mannose/cellobiose epimerase-like protein (N-acyl-D-glucosamine 2-epimerase family)
MLISVPDDQSAGRWRWKVRTDGSPLDDGKIVCGQSFVIFAPAEHLLSSGTVAHWRWRG